MLKKPLSVIAAGLVAGSAAAVDWNDDLVVYAYTKAIQLSCPAGWQLKKCENTLEFIEDELTDDGQACSAFLDDGRTVKKWAKYFGCIKAEYDLTYPERKFSNQETRPSGSVTIDTIRLNVRSAPNTGGRVLGTFAAGDRVNIFCVSGSWGAIDAGCSQWLNLHYTRR